MRGSWQGAPALVCADEQPCRRAVWLDVSRSKLARTMLILWLVLIGAGIYTSLAGCGPKKVEQPQPEVTCEPAADGQLQICWGVKVHKELS